ncbi:MAG: IPT/TIG domain-containing protein [Solirubrobacterales bacterium]
MGRKRLTFAVAALASAWALLTAAGAGATTITVGSVLPPGSAPEEFKEVGTWFNTALPEKGANLSSPVNGLIVRWRVQGASGGPFTLRVLRPNGNGAYTAVGSSSPATPSNEGVQTFAASIPVKSGDLIGLDATNASDKIGVATVNGAGYASLFPTPLEGATVAPRPGVDGKEIELAAEVQPQPVVKSISPAFGPLTGGAKVRITGTDLGGASAVMFGEQPAAAFTVESETQITATVPAFTNRGPQPVTVKTVAGTSELSSADEFTYTGCIVPKLKGRSLSSAKSALRHGGCKIGRVKKLAGATAANGKVVGQSVAKGKILAAGAKVKVTLKAKPEPKRHRKHRGDKQSHK